MSAFSDDYALAVSVRVSRDFLIPLVIYKIKEGFFCQDNVSLSGFRTNIPRCRILLVLVRLKLPDY